MQAHQWVFAAGGTLEDHPLAVIGMTEFAHFYRTRQGQAPISMPETKSGPMTNLMAVDLAYFRADPNFQAYRAAVSASRMIYTHRWGDLPLWGEYLRMYVDPQRTEFEWKAIHYYHASHGQMVNEDNSRYSWLQTLRNVSLGCTAVCNSRFAGCVSNPSAALNGKPTGAFTFHTNNSPTPFWEVDLGAEHVLKAVRILNRGDTCQERARGLVVEVSSDRNRYTIIHTQNDAFGGLLDTNPMVLDFRDSKNKPIGRYMRLRLPKDEYLHLDTVDVFA
jgi:hypothetical protein